MSTSPFSLDLREKVIKFLESGKTQSEASRVFKLNPKTVHAWITRYKTEGHYLPRVRLGAKPSIDKEKFIEYIKNNPTSRAEDIGIEFEISASGARYWLHKLGFSYKKNPTSTWKPKKKSGMNIKKI